MAETDRDYFARRAREERHAVKCAACSDARASHAELARRYEAAAAALDAVGDAAGEDVRRAVAARVSIDAERTARETARTAEEAAETTAPETDAER